MNPDNIVCTILKMETPTINGRVYPRAVIEDAVVRANFSSKRLWGQIGQPEFSGELSKVSHMVTDLFIEGDCLKAKIKLLDTAEGTFLGSLLARSPEGSVVFRTSGEGVIEDINGVSTVTSYTLTSVNAVNQDETIVYGD